MPCCLVALLVFFGPRLVMFFMWAFGNFFDKFQTSFIPFLGWLFLPWTTLAYGITLNCNINTSSPESVILIAIGIIFDITANVTCKRSN